MKYGLTLLLLLLACHIASAQWSIRANNVVGPFSNYAGRDAGSGIFFEHGRLWVASRSNADGTVRSQTKVSHDTGRTWQTVSLPFTFTNLAVAYLSFYDNNLGAIISNRGGLYLTNDGGVTWTLSPASQGGFKVLMLGPTRLIVTGNGPLLTTDGVNWTTFFPDEVFCLNKDNLGTLFCSGKNSFYQSRDLGNSWQRTVLSLDQDSYSISAHTTCHDSVIYIANEDDKGLYFNHTPSNKASDVFVSRDGGKTFKITQTAGPNADVVTGTVEAGRHGVAYCAVKSGVLLTTDYGESWQHIGGPGGILDGISFAMINDRTVAALDSLGNVWITENSGGVALPKPKPEPVLTQGFNLTNIKSCSRDSSEIKLTHVFCSPLTIKSISFDNALTSVYTITLPGLPLDLTEGQTLTIPVSFDPKTTVGSFPGSIHILAFYVDDGDTITIDTSINFNAVSTPVGPQLRRDVSQIDFGSISLCGFPLDTTIVLTNIGCDTLSIT